MNSQAPEATTPAREAQEPVGAELARARKAAGLSPEDTARQLKFAVRQLDALERGELNRLPGGAAVRGMVRSYARLLGLEPEPLLARVGAAMAPDAERLAQRFRQPVPFSDGTRRSNLAYIALSLALLAVVGFVFLQWQQDRAGAVPRDFVSAAAQQPAEPARVALADTAAEPAVSAPPAPSAQGVAAEAGRRRIELQFERESWVEIHSGSGKLLVSQLHPAGSERVVVGVPPFSVVIGNAHHVRLSYNGKPFNLKPHVKVEVARFTLQ